MTQCVGRREVEGLVFGNGLRPLKTLTPQGTVFVSIGPLSSLSEVIPVAVTVATLKHRAFLLQLQRNEYSPWAHQPLECAICLVVPQSTDR